MGGCFSSVYWSSQSQNQGESFSSAERSLDTGDIVLFAGGGFAKYLIKVDKWKEFSICGFIVREVPGPDGLLVYQCDVDLNKGEETETMIKQKLRTMLACETIDLCLVRKLSNPLTDEETTSLRRFLRENENKEFAGRAKLMMEDTLKNHDACCCDLQFERFQCSQLVASMLQEIGRVYQKEDLLYFPKGVDMQILQPPRGIALIPKVNSQPPSSSITQIPQQKLQNT